MSKLDLTLDSSNTFAAVVVRNDDSKLLSRMGHDHVIRAEGFHSTISIDLDDPGAWNFSLDFPVDQMVVDADQDRPRASLKGTVSARDQKATADNMLARGQLNAKKYKEIRFAVDGARFEDEVWILNARLTIRETECPFEFPVTIDTGTTLCIRGQAELTHSDVGLKPYKAPMGALRNREELLFLVDIEVDLTT